MKFALYLFDADHTLFDFDESERMAFAHALAGCGIEQDLADMLTQYRELSRALWLMFERGEVSKDELKIRRFTELFKRFGLTHDPALMSRRYLEALPRYPLLYPGAAEVVRELAARARIIIVTNGIEHVQRERLKSSALAAHIELMVVSEECGFPKPDARIFDYTLKKARHDDRDSVLMIGDRLDTDIEGARRAGIRGCWYNPGGAPRTGTIAPDFEIKSLEQLLKL